MVAALCASQAGTLLAPAADDFFMPETASAAAARANEIAGGEQAHLVSAPDELLGDQRNDAFGPAVQFRRHRLRQRSQHGDPHTIVLLL